MTEDVSVPMEWWALCSPRLGASQRNSRVPRRYSPVQRRELQARKYFHCLLSRLTEPEEPFGPVETFLLQRGLLVRVGFGLLARPGVRVAFLDEILKASSCFLNALLTLSQERRSFNWGAMEESGLPLLVGHTNELPGAFGSGRGVASARNAFQQLHAFLDRFPVRLLAWTNVASLLRAESANAPRGVLFCCGPSGTGKTMLAKKLAEFVFGLAEAFPRINTGRHVRDIAVQGAHDCTFGSRAAATQRRPSTRQPNCTFDGVSGISLSRLSGQAICLFAQPGCPTLFDQIHARLGEALASLIVGGVLCHGYIGHGSGRGVYYTVGALARLPRRRASIVTLVSAASDVYAQGHAGITASKIDADRRTQILTLAFAAEAHGRNRTWPDSGWLKVTHALVGVRATSSRTKLQPATVSQPSSRFTRKSSDWAACAERSVRSSEPEHDHDVSNLIGAPPRSVSYEGGGPPVPGRTPRRDREGPPTHRRSFPPNVVRPALERQPRPDGLSSRRSLSSLHPTSPPPPARAPNLGRRGSQANPSASNIVPFNSSEQAVPAWRCVVHWSLITGRILAGGQSVPE